MSTTVAKPTISSRAWGIYGVLGGVSASHAVTHLVPALMPLIYPIVMKEFGFSYGELGLMLGIASIVSGVLQMASGYATRFVRRRTLLSAESFLFTIALVAMSLVTSIPQFFGTMLLTRIATSPQHPIGSSLLAELFGRRLRGSAFAINFACGNLGTIFVPMVATFLIAGIGWRWTVALFALPGVIVGTLLMLIITEAKPAASMASIPGATRNPVQEAIQLLSHRSILMVFLISMVAAGGRGMGIVINYVPLYLRNGLELDAHTVGLLFTILTIGSVVGPLLGGRLSDLYGRRRIMIISYSLATLATAGIVLVGGATWYLLPTIVVLGLATYSEGPVLQTLLADSVRQGSRDFTFGLYFAASLAAGSVWTSVIGLLIDRNGFSFAFYVMAISYIAAGILAVFIREQTGDD